VHKLTLSEPSNKILLLTPPFTQLNTPYPATAYIKGFLNTLGYDAYQADLSLELMLAIFNGESLKTIFKDVEHLVDQFSDNSLRIFHLRNKYIECINPIIEFLQHKNQTFAHQICGRKLLPEASRFDQIEDLEWAFGSLGIYEKARHIATLFIEDIGDFITEVVDSDFGFSKYAERLGRTASSFDVLFESVKNHETIFTRTLDRLVEDLVSTHQPSLVCITAPFPGNVYGAFRIAKRVKEVKTNCKIVFGGGFANTELRRLSDERVFDYFDFVTLDDGETPLKNLLEYLEGKRQQHLLKRCFLRKGGVVCYINGSEEKDIPQREVGVPDYSDFFLDKYISVIDILNPMHRMWSDGRWNKMTLAHGCYWGKCTFCDVSLDYIGRYEPVDASILCDRIEQMIAQTGDTGFHFVDEAAPPALMKDLAIELIRRKIKISWWTNIRFEKAFTQDLCRLLAESGCIAISGGLEVASDRLLKLIQKGVTVSQVAQVSNALSSNGILVHAYLMYGFPTQTAQETVDALEYVRQMFEQGIVHSGFWHLFAMTAHSPVGLNPASFDVVHTGPTFEGFAENDYFHEDPKGCDHEAFSEGLRVSLFNYMNGLGMELPLSEWFDFKVPKTKVPKNFILDSISDQKMEVPRDHNVLLWVGGEITLIQHDNLHSVFTFVTNNNIFEITCPKLWATWLPEILERISPSHVSFKRTNMKEFKTIFDNLKLEESIDELLVSYLWYQLREKGLLVV